MGNYDETHIVDYVLYGTKIMKQSMLTIGLDKTQPLDIFLFNWAVMAYFQKYFSIYLLSHKVESSVC